MEDAVFSICSNKQVEVNVSGINHVESLKRARYVRVVTSEDVDNLSHGNNNRRQRNARVRVTCVDQRIVGETIERSAKKL